MVNAVNYLLEAGLIVFVIHLGIGVDIANVEVGVPDNIKQMIESRWTISASKAKNARSGECRRA
jgi:hypothetical protein